MLVEGMSQAIRKRKFTLEFNVLVGLKVGPRIATPLDAFDAAHLKSEIGSTGLLPPAEDC
jgi:lysyl-tRNA synthetase class I